MNRLRIKLLSIILTTLCLIQVCMAETPSSKAFIVLSSLNGDKDTLYAGDAASTSFEAPLDVYFDANMQGVEAGMVVFSEWRVSRSYIENSEQQQEEYLLRQESTTSYTINDFGTFSVSFAYSYKPVGSENTIEGETIDAISFSIDDSNIMVPNAFSPNGDGINDQFKVKVHSIVSFKMTIFNRWGQVIKTGNQDNLEYQGDDGDGYYVCWDGIRNGDVVNDGVYFIRIEAIGAGGRKYDKRSDINLLKGTGTEQ